MTGSLLLEGHQQDSKSDCSNIEFHEQLGYIIHRLKEIELTFNKLAKYPLSKQLKHSNLWQLQLRR